MNSTCNLISLLMYIPLKFVSTEICCSQTNLYFHPNKFLMVITNLIVIIKHFIVSHFIFLSLSLYQSHFVLQSTHSTNVVQTHSTMFKMPSMASYNQRAYMKHIQHCQPKLTGSSLLDHDPIRLLNPLLSLTTDSHSPNINCNCNLYVDQYCDYDYGEDKTSVDNNSNTSSSKDILDNDKINENILQEPFMSVNQPFPQQTNAST